MREEIRRLLDSYGFGPSILQAALRQLPKKMWCYRPREDRWSVHDLVVQLAELEACAYMNCRQLIAVSGGSALEIDFRGDARSFISFNQSVRESLKIISHLRKSSCRLLLALPDSLWDNVVIHPRDGSMTLHRWLVAQDRQIPFRIEQMRRIHLLWTRTQPKVRTSTNHRPESENSCGTPDLK